MKTVKTLRRTLFVCSATLAIVLLPSGISWAAQFQDGARQVLVTDGRRAVPSQLHVTEAGDVYAELSTPWPYHVNEFRWMADRGVLATPRLLIGDDADPGDLAFRRDGDVETSGQRHPISAGMNLGAIYWQPKIDGADHDGFPECKPNSWPKTTFGCRRAAQIGAVAAGPATMASTPGELVFYTTRAGQINGGLTDLKLSDPGDNETSVWLVVQRGGVETVHRVEIGPPDSGGAGYRMLRVAAP